MNKIFAVASSLFFALSALGQEGAPPQAPPPQAQAQPPQPQAPAGAPEGAAPVEGQPAPEGYQEPSPEEMGQATPPQPTEKVPPPPAAVPPPPSKEGEPPPEYAQPTAPADGGQWVFNTDYGWIWAPNNESYTYYPSSGYPYTYVYQPSFGWTWVVAPWVYGAVWPWHYRPYAGPFLGRYGWYHGAWGYYHPWGYSHGYRAFYGAHYAAHVATFRVSHPYRGGVGFHAAGPVVHPPAPAPMVRRRMGGGFHGGHGRR